MNLQEAIDQIKELIGEDGATWPLSGDFCDPPESANEALGICESIIFDDHLAKNWIHGADEEQADAIMLKIISALLWTLTNRERPTSSPSPHSQPELHLTDQPDLSQSA